MKKLLIAVAALAAFAAAPPSASAGPCGLPNQKTLWIDFADGSVPHWQLFARPGVIGAAANFIYPPRLRAAGAKTVYFDLNFRHRIGTPSDPEAAATVVDRAHRLFDYAAASMDCPTPWIALNELFGAGTGTPWSATNAKYRANVLAFVRTLASRGGRPFLLVNSKPYTGGEAGDWWREVGKVADIVREVYFPAPSIHKQGAVLGSRTMRQGLRRAAADFLAIGIPPSRLGIMLGFQTTPRTGGREGLQPASAWFRVTKLTALASKQVSGELGLATVWSWGWGAWSDGERDPDKAAAACVWLWARDPSLCDGPKAAGSGFNPSLSEAQITLPRSVQCMVGAQRIGQYDLARLTAMTRDRDVAYSALFARAAETERVRISSERILVAERNVILLRFGGSTSAYRGALARAGASVEVGRGVLADELRRAEIKRTFQVPQPSGTEIAAYYATYSAALARSVEATTAAPWLGGKKRGVALASIAPPQVFKLPTGRRTAVRWFDGVYRVRPLGAPRALGSIPLAQASGPIGIALKQFARTNAFQGWTISQQKGALRRARCARDELPHIAEVELASYLPFLAID
ncbi:MAG: hypothetical protein M3377_09610 [Actinomycetota bacterium]|nr:hypothetical protein [Actinomycetota bacterium]